MLRYFLLSGPRQAAVGVSLVLAVSLFSPPVAWAATLFADGFESGDMSSWTRSTAVTVQQAEVHAGTWAARATSNASASFAIKTLATAQPRLFVRTWFKIMSQTTTISLMRIRTEANAVVDSIGVNSSHQLLWRNDVLRARTTSATVVSIGVWHELQMRTLVNGPSSEVEVWLDGVRVDDLSGTVSLGTAPLARIQVGDNGLRTADVVYDDVVVDTAYVGGPPDTTPPSTPTGLAATTPTGNRVDLTWDASPESDVAGYTLYRGGVQLATVSGAATASFTDTSVHPSTTYSYTIDAFDMASPPNRSQRSAPVTITTPAGTTTDPVIAAAGDIACDPASGAFRSGNGTARNCHMKATGAILQDLLSTTNLERILPVGDTQYECGGLEAYNQSYALSWGRSALKAITSPVPGEQEYLTSGGTGCSPTPGGGYFSYFGSAAGDPSKGYYSYDVGAWHIVALNSVCGSVGGCGVGSPQYQFLQADLAGHPATCTLAYWHHPRFTSSRRGGTTKVAPFWDLLYGAGAEIVLGGNHHVYERFAPQTPSQQASANGIREFTVGTGGKSLGRFSSDPPNTEVRSATYGVLKLTLHSTSYDWEFIPEAGKTFTDSGTTNCH